MSATSPAGSAGADPPGPDEDAADQRQPAVDPAAEADPACERVPLSSLRNLGPVTERRLVEVGIADAAELDRVGAVEAYRRLRERWPRDTSLVALYALAGALLDLPWNALPPDLVADLRRAAGR